MPVIELEIDSWRLRVGLVEHGLPSYGYRLEEMDSPGPLDAKGCKWGCGPGQSTGA